MKHWARPLPALMLLALGVGVLTPMPSAPALTTCEGRFGDDNGNQHEPNIEAIAAAGITQGCADDRYCPAKAVTRAEMAAFLLRAIGEADNSPSYQGYFWDVPAGQWYTGYVERLFELGITEGFPDGGFHPGEIVNRAQMGAFILRTIGEDQNLPPAQGYFADVAGDAWYRGYSERMYQLGITTGCANNPLRYCPAAPAHRDEMASFLTRALNLTPIPTGCVISPGEDIQALVDANPEGTSFVIKAGTHRRQSVVPKDGNTFVGEPGAVLTGEGVTAHAFRGSARNVTIRGLVIEHYAPPVSRGAIAAKGYPSPCSRNWLIEDNEVRFNATGGITICHEAKVVGNNVHHNGQWGIAGPGEDVLIEGNEIAFNNTADFDSSFEAGGTKFVGTSNLVVRGNNVHDNKGPGLWTDGNNINTIYEDNLVVDNRGPGIFHEISYDAVIRDNVVQGNGWGSRFTLDGAGILVFASPNVEIFANVVSGNADGIAGKHDTRAGTPQHGPWELRNLYVHDNVITMTDGYTGVIDWSGGVQVFEAWNNRFRANTYVLGPNPRYYFWQGGPRTTQEWIGYGQDVNGIWK